MSCDGTCRTDSKAFQPFLHLGFASAHLVSVDAEAFHYIGLGKSFLNVAYAVGQSAAFVGGEGNDCPRAPTFSNPP